MQCEYFVNDDPLCKTPVPMQRIMYEKLYGGNVLRKSFIIGRSYFCFSLCALSAMTAGILFAVTAEPEFLSRMRLAPDPVSILWLLPFLCYLFRSLRKRCQ